MKIKYSYILLALALIVYSVLVFRLGVKSVKAKDKIIVKSDTVRVNHTDHSPRVVFVKELKSVLFTRVVRGSTDTVSSIDTVFIPMSQKTYEGDGYTAYVSGYNQSLDSIKIRERIVTNTVVKKRSRWNIGLSAGYGITPKGFQPYVGVGVTWNLFK